MHTSSPPRITVAAARGTLRLVGVTIQATRRGEYAVRLADRPAHRPAYVTPDLEAAYALGLTLVEQSPASLGAGA